MWFRAQAGNGWLLVASILIRRATEPELPQLVGFLRVCFADGFEQAGHPWHTESVAAMVSVAMSGRGVAFVAIMDGQIAGAMLCVATPYPTDHRQFRAAEIAWHADPALPVLRRGRIMIKLLEAAETWAECVGMPLFISASNHADKWRVGAWLAKRGYEQRETIYARKADCHGA